MEHDMEKKIGRLNCKINIITAIMLVVAIGCGILILTHAKTPAPAAVTTHGGGGGHAEGGTVHNRITMPDRFDAIKKRAALRGHLTPGEYAELLGLHTDTVYRRLATGEIEGAEKHGAQWRIPMEPRRPAGD